MKIDELPEPRSLGAGAMQRCVRLKGWWRGDAVQIRVGNTQPRWLRPFAFVRERNPSAGWPSWSALDAVLVELDGEQVKGAQPTPRLEPMLVESIAIRGVLRALDASDAEALWNALFLARDQAAAPFGQNLLPVVGGVGGGVSPRCVDTGG